MGHYRSNLRDIEFNLFEVFGRGDVLGTGPFAQVDADSAREILREIERMATTVFADGFVEGDRVGARLVGEGDVVVPPGIHRAMDAYFGGEWHRLVLPERLGGYGAPPSLVWACTEMLMGANPSALLYLAGPFFATIMDPLVTPEQRERFIWPMVERHWGATMVLTEPDAGSDVGAGRARAVDAGDGTWHLTGTKRFITNGDFDWPENIVHLVLARPDDARPGTKGLSLFLVPKYWPEADGSPGQRNGAVVTGIEDKMGIKASATCTLTLGEHAPARGVLVGEVHDGIRQMFEVITYARMLIGVKAMATLSTGYRNALEYAEQRIQGPDLALATDPQTPRVAIIRHPDVRRMLMTQKAHAEGMRALALYAACLQDDIVSGRAEGADVTALERRNDLLLPLVKGYGSEKSYELLALSLQILGGSGYCRDYPMEQYLRDAKIDTLYEGTTGIQSLDLFFRKIARDQGAALAGLLGEVGEFAKGDAGNGALDHERALLATALEDLGGMLGALVGFLGHEDDKGVYLVGLQTVTLLNSLAEVLIGWLLLRQAEVALDQPADDFYTGKVAAARFFARTVLPQLSSRRAVVEATDLELMELPDTAF